MQVQQTIYLEVFGLIDRQSPAARRPQQVPALLVPKAAVDEGEGRGEHHSSGRRVDELHHAQWNESINTWNKYQEKVSGGRKRLWAMGKKLTKKNGHVQAFLLRQDL